MNPIVWDIHYGLPNQKYYDLVNYCMRTPGNYSLDDPFMIDLPLGEIENFYVEREGVDRQILESGCKIVVGKRGSGKTSLWQKRFSESKKKLHRDVLHLSLILTEHNIPKQDWEAFFAYHIFKVYRDRLLDSSSEIAPFLSTLICDLQWRNTFHRLYYHCCLKHQERSKREFLPWENRELLDHSSRGIPSGDVLRELCHFIVYPIPGYDQRFGGQTAWPYKEVQVFLDFADDLSEETFLDLIQGLQRVCAVPSDVPDIKLFISRDLGDLVDKSAIYAQGLVYHLPPWSRDELYNLLAIRFGYYKNNHNSQASELSIPESILKRLRKILLKCPEFENNQQLSVVFMDARIAGWRYGLPEASNLQARVNAVIDYLFKSYNDKGENIFILFLYVLSDLRTPSDQLYQQLRKLINDLRSITQPSSQQIDFNWLNIPTNGLKYDDRPKFIQIIVNGALRAYTHPTNFDAPIHALRLARGLIAACAGCWEDRFPPPLNARQLQEIVDLYWEEENG